MNNEFNDRMSAQRAILRTINCRRWPVEELFGLSSKAIDRWVMVNQLNRDSAIVDRIRQISSKLFLLANKSQEQISEQYVLIRSSIADDCELIRIELQDV